MQTPDEMIAAIEAFKRDGQVHGRTAGGPWMVTGCPTFNFTTCEFRPVPKPKEIWVNEYTTEYISGYTTREGALNGLLNGHTRKAVRYIEADPQ